MKIGTVERKVNVVLANEPKVGEKVLSFRGGRSDLPLVEHILIEKIDSEKFRSDVFSVIHRDNIYYELKN